MRLVLLGLLSLPSVAWGHAGDMIESLDVHPPQADFGSAGLESSIGWLWAENGEDYSWVCHEAVTHPESLFTPRYIRSTSGFTLAAVARSGEGREEGETLYRSTDHCDWNAVQGLTGRVVQDLSIDPAAPDTVFLVVNHPEESADNGVFLSTDTGLTFSATPLGASDRLFRSVLAKQGVVWATSVDSGGKAAFVYRSLDHGETWEEWSIDTSDKASPPDVLALDVHPDGLWFRVTQTLEDDLWLLDDAGPRRVYSSDTKLMSGAQTESDGLTVSLWAQGIGRFDGTTMSVIEGSPLSYQVREQGGTLYAASRPLFNNFGMMTSTNGVDFEGAFSYDQLGSPPTCEAETHSVEFCDPLWETLAERLKRAEPPDTGDTGDTGEVIEPHRGCAGKKKNQGWLLFALPALWFPWRKKRCCPT